jgi:tripeptide aminopeptidase
MMVYTVSERFLKYVKVDTQADPTSETYPSSEKQKDLSKIILAELKEMGIAASTNEAGYVYAHLPATTDQAADHIFFCSHLDTAPDCSGTDVKPIVHKNYQGGDLVLPDDTSQTLTPDNHPALARKIGHDIITASGLTLLGADDKAGVAAIMDAFYQMSLGAIEHGPVSLLFTTDEEVGRGTHKVDFDLLGASYGYTLDSGEVGHMEFENFSADAATLQIQGVSAHPGTAKGKMQNAIRIASEIILSLPQDRLTPETTEGREGFIHPGKLHAELESATIDFILRDFDTKELQAHANLIRETAAAVCAKYPGATTTLEVKQQYRNMREVLDHHPDIVKIAKQAMQRVGITPVITGIRGGTDGAILSHKGLPCPNIFAGQHAIHSRQEWTTIQDMQKAVDTVLEICKIVAGH